MKIIPNPVYRIHIQSALTDFRLKGCILYRIQRESKIDTFRYHLLISIFFKFHTNGTHSRHLAVKFHGISSISSPDIAAQSFFFIAIKYSEFSRNMVQKGLRTSFFSDILLYRERTVYGETFLSTIMSYSVKIWLIYVFPRLRLYFTIGQRRNF